MFSQIKQKKNNASQREATIWNEILPSFWRSDVGLQEGEIIKEATFVAQWLQNYAFKSQKIDFAINFLKTLFSSAEFIEVLLLTAYINSVR